VTTLATRTFFCLLLLASAAVPAAAQLQLAAVRGVVTAEDGVLPGATVELADPLGGRIDSRITGADGRFAFPAVAPGRYLLRASLPGFKAADHAITVDTSLPLEVTLRLALHGVIEVFVDEAGLPDSPAARASIAGASIARVSRKWWRRCRAGRPKTTACCMCAVSTTDFSTSWMACPCMSGLIR
jgi:hypothetical protein